MKNLMDLVNAPDLATRARLLLSFVDTADPCFVGLLVVLLGFLGAKMVAGHPGLQRWGLRLAAATFLVYAGHGCYQAGGVGGGVLPGIALRGLIAGGAVLAVTWIVLPVLAFVYRYIRLAAAAGLGYGGYALVTAPRYDPDELRGIGLRALAVAGLAMVIAWIAQPAWDFLRSLAGRPAADGEKRPARPPRPARPCAGSDEGQRRREQTRLQAEMHYALALPAANARWSRAAFDDFVRRHLGDDLPAEQVEENGRRLLDMLRGLPAAEPVAGTGLEELTRWYLEEQKRLQTLDLNPDTRQDRLRALHRDYLARAERFVRGPLELIQNAPEIR